MIPALIPTPRVGRAMVGSLFATLSVLRTTRFHTAGFAPEPMWQCRVLILRSYFFRSRVYFVEVVVPDSEASRAATGVCALRGPAATPDLDAGRGRLPACHT